MTLQLPLGPSVLPGPPLATFHLPAPKHARLFQPGCSVFSHLGLAHGTQSSTQSRVALSRRAQWGRAEAPSLPENGRCSKPRQEPHVPRFVQRPPRLPREVGSNILERGRVEGQGRKPAPCAVDNTLPGSLQALGQCFPLSGGARVGHQGRSGVCGIPARRRAPREHPCPGR